MKFENRLWKIDTNNLWWNANRIACRDAILFHFENGGRRALLNGCKGCGKTTLTHFLADKWDVDVYKVEERDSGTDFEFSDDIVIVDEAQKISPEDRQSIFHKYPRVLMVSVSDDLIDDGYDLLARVEKLDRSEVASYINYQKSLHLFTPEAITEVHKASRGILRMVNHICKRALEEYDDVLINRNTVEYVAKRIFKLRY